MKGCRRPHLDSCACDGVPGCIEYIVAVVQIMRLGRLFSAVRSVKANRIFRFPVRVQPLCGA